MTEHTFSLSGTGRLRMGSSIGQPVSRLDGALKTTGAAMFASDYARDGLLYAVMAVSSFARGHVTSLDVDAAMNHPGVVEVMRPGHAPALAMSPDEKENIYMFRLDLLQNTEVRYANQPIAVVIARSLEAATEGAALLAPRYDIEAPVLGLDGAEAFVPDVVNEGHETTAVTGNATEAFATSVRQLDETYTTAAQYHNPLEPHAIVAEWDGDKLFLDTPSQFMALAQSRIAGLFGIQAEDVTVRCRFLGGGFGSKAFFSGPQVLGVMAARMVNAPVKLVMTRPQMYGPVGHRAETRQTLRLGAGEDGTLNSLDHHTLTSTSMFDDYYESSSILARKLYAAPNISTTHTAVRINSGTPLYMRGPGEASGSVALETAVDEMAWACGLDPLEFRLRNYADQEPISGKPFSSKALRECYQQGAAQFGWSARPLDPRQMVTSAGLLKGWGVGTAIFPAQMNNSHAKAFIRRDGTGGVEAGFHDMGQGAATAFAQVAADSLALPLDRIDVRFGSSENGDAGIAGGSGHMATHGAAIHAAGSEVISQLIELARRDTASPLFSAGNVGIVARDGCLRRADDDSISQSFEDILASAGKEVIEGTGNGAMDPQAAETYSMHAHGAVFAEVLVDPDLGQIRVSRMVGAFAAGNVINPKMVRSQYFGGMIWGLSMALHEHAVTDKRTGRIMSANLADYHIPTNADVPKIEAILVHEDDRHVNALGIKGVGEIGITGTVGAIGNAIWHATGKRIRDFPITLDRLL